MRFSGRIVFRSFDSVKSPRGGQRPENIEGVRAELTDDQKLSVEFTSGVGEFWTGSMQPTSDGYHSGTFRGDQQATARATGYIRRSEDGKLRVLGDWFETYPDQAEPSWDGLFFAELAPE